MKLTAAEKADNLALVRQLIRDGRAELDAFREQVYALHPDWRPVARTSGEQS